MTAPDRGAKRHIALASRGPSTHEILEAAHVAAYYNMSNRPMSALGVKPQPEAFFARREASCAQE